MYEFTQVFSNDFSGTDADANRHVLNNAKCLKNTLAMAVMQIRQQQHQQQRQQE